MAVARNLMIRAGADFSSLRSQLANAKKNVQEFKTGMNSALGGIGTAFAGIGIGVMIESATRTAMAVEASMQQINRAMGKSAEAFAEWSSSSAQAFNISKADAIKYGAIFSNLISTFSGGAQKTETMTVDLMKTSAVIASSTGRTMEDVMWRIRSGLLGNTEAIEDLGVSVYVNMLQSTKAFKDFANGRSWDQLDFQTQQLIRYYGILEQANKKFGVEISVNTNSRLQGFTRVLGDVRLALGQAFIPILNAVLPILTALASHTLHVMQIFAQFTRALFGYDDPSTKVSKGADQQASSVNALGDAYEAAGKKAQKSVAGFDQVNLVGQKDSTGGGSGASNPSLLNPPIEDPGTASAYQKISEKVQSVANAIRGSVKDIKDAYGSLSGYIQQHSDIIIASLAGVGTAVGLTLLVTNLGKIKAAFELAVLAIRVWALQVVEVIAAINLPIVLLIAVIALLVAGFVYFYRTNEQFRDTVNGILDNIAKAAVNLWENVLKPFGDWLATVMVQAWDVVTKSATWLWKNVLVPIGDFLLWFAEKVLWPIVKILGEFLAIAFDVVAKAAEMFWKKVLVPLGQALSEMLGPAVEAISAVLKFLWNDVIVPFGEFIKQVFEPIVQLLISAFEYLWKNVLKPFVTFVGDVLLAVLSSLFDSIGGAIDGLKTAFIGLMDFITGVFTGDWGRAWEGVKDVFAGVFETLWEIAKAPLNAIISGINAVIKGLNSLDLQIPDWVPLFGGQGFSINIPQIPKLAKGGLAYGPTLAMVGDNAGASSDPEVIAPLSKLASMLGGGDNREVVTVLRSILEAIRSTSGGDIGFNKTDLARAAAYGMNDIARRTGKSILNL